MWRPASLRPRSCRHTVDDRGSTSENRRQPLRWPANILPAPESRRPGNTRLDADTFRRRANVTQANAHVRVDRAQRVVGDEDPEILDRPTKGLVAARDRSTEDVLLELRVAP